MFNKTKDSQSSLPEQFGRTEANRRRSVLHGGITIEGKWTSDGIVDFGGIFQGELNVETLALAKEGQIQGNIRAQIVTIEGTVEGTILAQSVNIKNTAKVTADIIAETIAIEAGAAFEGKISCSGKVKDR